MTPGRTPEPGRDLGHPLLGRRARRPERDHVAGHRRRARGRARDHRPVLEPVEDRVGETRPAERRGQAQLVATGQEDARRLTQRERGGLVVGLRPGDRVEGHDALDPELPEDRAVALAGLEAQGRCRADDHDGRVRAAREGHEAAQDDAVPDLVLRAADDDDCSVGHDLAEYTGATPHDRSRDGVMRECAR